MNEHQIEKIKTKPITIKVIALNTLSAFDAKNQKQHLIGTINLYHIINPEEWLPILGKPTEIFIAVDWDIPPTITEASMWPELLLGLRAEYGIDCLDVPVGRTKLVMPFTEDIPLTDKSLRDFFIKRENTIAFEEKYLNNNLSFWVSRFYAFNYLQNIEDIDLELKDLLRINVASSARNIQ